MQEQIRFMRRRFPGFRVVADWGWVVHWEGEVQPLSQRYRLRIMYVLKDRVGPMLVTTYYPQIWLLAPALCLESKYAPGVTVPHIYKNVSNPKQSRLCLFDPMEDEWDRGMAIADTIVPWAIDWLVSYEGWLATGEWTGGGRDHTIPRSESCATNPTPPQSQDRTALFVSDAFPRIGLPIGNFEFSPLTEAVSAVFSPQLSSLSWKSDFLRAVPFVTNLILSREPLPAASLP